MQCHWPTTAPWYVFWQCSVATDAFCLPCWASGWLAPRLTAHRLEHAEFLSSYIYIYIYIYIYYYYLCTSFTYVAHCACCVFLHRLRATLWRQSIIVTETRFTDGYFLGWPRTSRQHKVRKHWVAFEHHSLLASAGMFGVVSS